MLTIAKETFWHSLWESSDALSHRNCIAHSRSPAQHSTGKYAELRSRHPLTEPALTQLQYFQILVFFQRDSNVSCVPVFRHVSHSVKLNNLSWCSKILWTKFICKVLYDESGRISSCFFRNKCEYLCSSCSSLHQSTDGQVRRKELDFHLHFLTVYFSNLMTKANKTLRYTCNFPEKVRDRKGFILIGLADFNRLRIQHRIKQCIINVY